jgi:hypothetical protein
MAIMSIQSLMQKGAETRSLLEKASDAILAFPRGMWLNRSIQVITTGEQPKTIDKDGKSFMSFFPSLYEGSPDEATKLVALFSGVVFAAASIIATPFLAVGLTCKKIALMRDKKANQYNKLVESAIKDQELVRKKAKMDSSLEKIQNDLDALGLDKLPEIDPEGTTLAEKSMRLERKRLLSMQKKLQAEKEALMENAAPLRAQIEQTHKKVEELFKQYKASA